MEDGSADENGGERQSDPSSRDPPTSRDENESNGTDSQRGDTQSDREERSGNEGDDRITIPDEIGEPTTQEPASDGFVWGGRANDEPDRIPLAIDDEGERDGDRITIGDWSTDDEEDERSAAGDADGEDDHDVLGPEPNTAPIEPETPSLESVIFVLLGALAMLAVMVRISSLFLA